MELLCEDHHSKPWHIIPVATLPKHRLLCKNHAPWMPNRVMNVIIPFDPAVLDVQQNVATLNGNSCNMSVIPEACIDESEEYMGYMDMRGRRRSLNEPRRNDWDAQRRRWSFDDSQTR